MVSTYILSIEDFEERADISANIKTNQLKIHLGVVQEKYAVKILCLDFYEEVLDYVVQAETTPDYIDNPEIANLIPYLKDYLIYKTYVRYLLYANQKSTAAGVRVVSEPVSTPASDKLISEMIGNARSDANFYQDQLVNFLLCNEDDYPTWKDSICNCGDKHTRNLNRMSVVGSKKTVTKVKWT